MWDLYREDQCMDFLLLILLSCSYFVMWEEMLMRHKLRLNLEVSRKDMQMQLT